MAKTIVFDFDGVIHSYSSGYQGAHTELMNNKQLKRVFKLFGDN